MTSRRFYTSDGNFNMTNFSASNQYSYPSDTFKSINSYNNPISQTFNSSYFPSKDNKNYNEYEKQAITNTSANYEQMKEDLKVLRQSIDNLSKKFEGTFRSHEPIASSSSSSINPYYSYNKSPFLKANYTPNKNDYEQEKSSLYSKYNNLWNERAENDIKEKLRQKELEILDLKNKIETQKSENAELAKKIKELEDTFDKEKKEDEEATKEITNLNDVAKNLEEMKNGYNILKEEFKKSEIIRNNQKEQIKSMQSDIDSLRKATIDRISQLEQDKKLRPNKSDLVSPEIELDDNNKNVLRSGNTTDTKTKKKKKKKAKSNKTDGTTTKKVNSNVNKSPIISKKKSPSGIDNSKPVIKKRPTSANKASSTSNHAKNTSAPKVKKVENASKDIKKPINSNTTNNKPQSASTRKVPNTKDAKK